MQKCSKEKNKRTTEVSLSVVVAGPLSSRKQAKRGGEVAGARRLVCCSRLRPAKKRKPADK